MGKLLPGLCGKIVRNLRTILWTTCDRLSTLIIKKIFDSQQDAKNYPTTHCLYQRVSDRLSPARIIKLPLMNTIFTQFPQHLLLQPLKKKLER